jgi:ribosome-associated protein
MSLEITPTLVIPDTDLSFAFVRASGPGGQNVNKVSSAVQLRFDMAGTTALSDAVKSRLRALAGRRLTDDGAILIIARNQRSQDHNRREALERLADLISKALIAPKARKATKPTRASRERRLEGKNKAQQTKQARRKVRRWDD